MEIDTVIHHLENWPTEENINWSEVPRKVDITQANGGQIVKEIAQRHGINTARLAHTAEGDTTPKTSRSKSKLSGGEISMPCLPTREIITNEKKQLFELGVLSIIGEPCTPYTVTKSVVKSDGNIEIKTDDTQAKKFPEQKLGKDF